MHQRPRGSRSLSLVLPNDLNLVCRTQAPNEFYDGGVGGLGGFFGGGGGFGGFWGGGFLGGGGGGGLGGGGFWVGPWASSHADVNCISARHGLFLLSPVRALFALRSDRFTWLIHSQAPPTFSFLVRFFGSFSLFFFRVVFPRPRPPLARILSRPDGVVSSTGPLFAKSRRLDSSCARIVWPNPSTSSISLPYLLKAPAHATRGVFPSFLLFAFSATFQTSFRTTMHFLSHFSTYVSLSFLSLCFSLLLLRSVAISGPAGQELLCLPDVADAE